jgi:hypothetical protein
METATAQDILWPEVELIRNEFPILQQTVNGRPLVYLDNGATTQKPVSVIRSMQEYYRRWQFKHPQPEDFRKVMEESSGKNLDAEFSYLGKTGLLPNQQRKGSKTIFLFNGKAMADFGNPRQQSTQIGELNEINA